jgi:uncharacterized protein YcbK (DUF882 family)
MAYLPTVNETKEPLNVGDTIVKSLQKRLDFSAFKDKLLLSPQDVIQEKLATKQDTSTSLLNKLYQFIVKDTYRQNLSEEEQLREQDDESEENEFIQNTLIQEVEPTKDKPKEEKEEGIFGKLLQYFKYFSFGRMVYRNWDTISKLLGLEKLTETIKSISEEFGVTKVFDEIKTAINSIMDGFGLGDFKFATSTSEIESGAVKVGEATMPKDPKLTKIITDTASKFGIDPAAMMAIARAESGFQTGIGADTSTAKGLFQITKGTWAGLQKQHAELRGKDVTDPEANVLGAAYLMKEIKSSGIDITDPNKLYAGMFFGPEAKKFLSAPDTKIAAEVMSKSAVEANLPVFYKDYKKKGKSEPKTIGEMKQTMQSKVGSYVPAYAGILSGTQQPETTMKPLSPKGDSESSPIITQPTRVANNYAERGETGDGMTLDQRKELVSRDLATEGDLRGLQFVQHSHGEDKKILKTQAQKVQQLRSALGLGSLIITCGYRPPWYNKQISKKNKGVAKDSYHMRGKACDIAIPMGYKEQDIANFVRTASKVGFGGIGVYLGDGFIHVDIGPVRTWTYGLPKLIQDALTEHTSGRLGHQVIKDVPNIENPEPGETGKTSGETLKQQEEQKKQDPLDKLDFIQEALDAYRIQTAVLGKVFNESFSKQSVVKMEEMLSQLSGEIPRKDSILPDVSGLFAQNNLTINNISQNKNIHRIAITSESDIPPIFANPFISNYYKD